MTGFTWRWPSGLEIGFTTRMEWTDVLDRVSRDDSRKLGGPKLPLTPKAKA